MVQKVTRVASLLALAMFLSHCVTPGEKKQMQGDIMNAQTRLLKLEQTLNESTQASATSSDNLSKRTASTMAQLERINQDLRKMAGEIDAIRIGVITGQMPGTPNSDESVASSLANLGERLAAVEQAQEDLLDTIKKSGVKKRKKKSRSKSKSVTDLQGHFEKKRYAYVVEDATSVIKKTSGEDKEQALYLHAESLYKLGKLREAALKYNDFIEAKPSQKYLPQAKLRMGDSFRHLGDAETAKLYYEEVVSDFPSSEQAKTAKERVQDLAGNG